MKKYEMTDETKIFLGITLHRIRALTSFEDVDAGELGGWIESEDNLSQEDIAWVSGSASVYGSARVSGSARVYGSARVESDSDYLSISPIGSEDGIFTAYKGEDGIECNRGCFEGTLEKFEEAVRETHDTNQIAEEYRLVIELVRLRLKG